MAYIDYKTVSRVLPTTYVTQPYHINGQYGYSYNHWGIDLVCYNDWGTCLGDVLAHSDGTVIGLRNNCTGFESGSYGNFVLIAHNNGMQTLYAHLEYKSVCVYVGQDVKQGQKIGYMGNTGESYGGHLHFEIRNENGYQIDPTPFLDSPLYEQLKVNGVIDYTFIKRLQEVLRIDYNYIVVDGYISHQLEACKNYFPAIDLKQVEFDDTRKGSLMVKAIQEVLKFYGFYDKELDGLMGYNTVLGIQKFLNMFGYELDEDGILGYYTACAYAKFLNNFYV